MCNGSVFEKDNTSDNKEDKDEKEDTKADQPWLAQATSLSALLAHFHLRVGWTSPASLALL